MKAVFILLPVKYLSASCVAIYVYMYITWNFAVVSFSPHAYNAGVFEKNLITLDPTSWSIKEVSMRRTRKSDYRALTLPLSHRSLTVGLRYSPWYVRGYLNTMRLNTWPGNRSFVNAEESWRFRWVIEWLTSLSLYHDSQFSAFSTKVFIRINQKDNRSSSPFTTLADRAERKVVSTGAGQPNYWPKTWFGANAYNAKFGVPNIYKKCLDFSIYTGLNTAPSNGPWCIGIGGNLTRGEPGLVRE